MAAGDLTDTDSTDQLLAESDFIDTDSTDQKVAASDFIDKAPEVAVLGRMSLEVRGGVGGVAAVLDAHPAHLAVNEVRGLGEPLPDLARVPGVPDLFPLP